MTGTFFPSEDRPGRLLASSEPHGIDVSHEEHEIRVLCEDHEALKEKDPN
jgi:hypothetical protein